MECECGFKFAGPGEFRNCPGYVNDMGESCVICPDCGRHYANLLSKDTRLISEDEFNERES